MRFRSLWTIALPLLSLPFASAPLASAAAEDDGPVYLIVSLAPSFDVVTNRGSPTILLEIGTLLGGGPVGGAQYLASNPKLIPLPGHMTFSDLADNATTIVGAFRAGDASVHLMTPVPDPIPADVQVAFFDAAKAGALAALTTDRQGDPSFPYTRAIAEAIADHLPAGSPYGVDDVLEHVFATDLSLHLTSGDTASVDAEGELFPHEPDSEPAFTFSFTFDEDGNFESELCQLVEVDVAPGQAPNTVNIGKKGDLSVAILTTDTFDALDVDDTTVSIGGVAADRTSVDDVDDDGDDDLVCHFDVPALVAAGAIDASSTSLAVEAERPAEAA